MPREHDVLLHIVVSNELGGRDGLKSERDGAA